MIDEPEIFRAAKLLIDQHGKDAALRAVERADELLEEGDLDGSAVWRRILAAVEELRRGPRDGEPLNWSPGLADLRDPAPGISARRWQPAIGIARSGADVWAAGRPRLRLTRGPVASVRSGARIESADELIAEGGGSKRRGGGSDGRLQRPAPKAAPFL